MTKQLKTKEDFYLEFSDSELADLGIKKGDKFEIKCNGDGSIILKPFSSLEIDLSLFTKDELIEIIKIGEKEDQTFGNTVVNILSKAVEDFKKFGF